MMKTHLRMAIASLILLLGTVSAFAQQQISGTVKDQAGEPIIGASVVVPGTTNGVITDVNGAWLPARTSRSRVSVMSPSA